MRRLVVLLVLLALAAGCNPAAEEQTAHLALGGKPDSGPQAREPAAPASAAPVDPGVDAGVDAGDEPGGTEEGGAPRRTPEPLPPAALEPVETLLPEVRLHSPDGAALEPDVVAGALGTPGVSFATMLSVGAVPVTLPDGRAGALRLAGVDPAGFRTLVPQITADEPGVWQRLAEGHLALIHEQAEELELGLDDALGAPGGALHLAAIAAIGHPPVAGGVVDLMEGLRLGLGPPTELLVAVEPDAWPDEVAAALETALGLEATLIYGKPQRRIDGLPDATVWDDLAACESSGDWGADTGNGYHGGLQFLPSTWHLVGGVGLPHEASRDEQISRAELVLQRQGWRAWPVCSVRLGLREPEADEHPDGRPKRPPPSPTNEGPEH